MAPGSSPEVMDDQAEGAIKSLYSDITSTLNVPFTPLPFRLLAGSCPDYLQVAWRALKPNISIAFFEARSDALRRQALRSALALWSEVPAVGNAEATLPLRILNYVNPRLLLAVSALQAATNGQEPRLQELSQEEKQQVFARGATDSSLALLDPDPQQATALGEVIRTSLVPDDLRVLAGHLEWAEAYSGLIAEADRVSLRRQIRDLQGNVRQFLQVLPFRMDLSAHTLRQSGLSEQDLDGIRGLISTVCAMLPVQTLATARLSARALGEEQAALPAFPAQREG